MNTKNTYELHGYEAPSLVMVELSPEGILCESLRQIENFELLDEVEW